MSIKLFKFIDIESKLTAFATDVDFAYELLSIKAEMLGFSHPLISNIKPFKPFRNASNSPKSKSVPEVSK